jgi:bifunctional DNA-binding transcriptional regulator/antitoxin component of YhaV-PrlF toxin-antitoxin module
MSSAVHAVPSDSALSAQLIPKGFPRWVMNRHRNKRVEVALYLSACYNAVMASATNAKVSHRGQTSLPADLRHRWGIDDGGEIGFVDLGDAALIVPGGLTAARRELRRVLRDRYGDGLAALDDPDLADQ